MDKEFIRQLRRLAIERRPEACLSCGFEHGCSTHGCAVIKKALETIKTLNDFDKSQSKKLLEHIAELEKCKAAAFMMVRNNILPIGKNYGKTDLEIDVMTIETLNKMREMLKMADAIALMRAAESALKEQEDNDATN